LLAIELQGLVDLDFEIELTGFSLAEVDIVLDEARESATDGADASIEDNIPAYRHEGPAVNREAPHRRPLRAHRADEFVTPEHPKVTRLCAGSATMRRSET
jgi:hypothetical protein